MAHWLFLVPAAAAVLLSLDIVAIRLGAPDPSNPQHSERVDPRRLVLRTMMLLGLAVCLLVGFAVVNESRSHYTLAAEHQPHLGARLFQAESSATGAMLEKLRSTGNHIALGERSFFRDATFRNTGARVVQVSESAHIGIDQIVEATAVLNLLLDAGASEDPRISVQVGLMPKAALANSRTGKRLSLSIGKRPLPELENVKSGERGFCLIEVPGEEGGRTDAHGTEATSDSVMALVRANLAIADFTSSGSAELVLTYMLDGFAQDRPVRTFFTCPQMYGEEFIEGGMSINIAFDAPLKRESISFVEFQSSCARQDIALLSRDPAGLSSNIWTGGSEELTRLEFQTDGRLDSPVVLWFEQSEVSSRVQEVYLDSYALPQVSE